MRYCVHGQPICQDGGRPDLNPKDPGIMEFYLTCDCCLCLMRVDAPFPGNWVLQDGGQIFCRNCHAGEKIFRKSKKALG